MAVTSGQNEISARAAKFAEEWKDPEREEAEAQSFLIDFFGVPGVSRKQVAIFEHKIAVRTPSASSDRWALSELNDRTGVGCGADWAG